jgi:hypothetical protein
MLYGRLSVGRVGEAVVGSLAAETYWRRIVKEPDTGLLRAWVLGRFGLLSRGLEFVLDRGRCCARRRTLECAGSTDWCRVG